MSVLIKGMKMPEHGLHVLSLYVYSDGTMSIIGVHKRYEGEPFECFEVPTPHGRLIDEAYISKVEWYTENGRYNAQVGEFETNAPTVIEAEE